MVCDENLSAGVFFFSRKEAKAEIFGAQPSAKPTQGGL
jgi:hypothetical protein